MLWRLQHIWDAIIPSYKPETLMSWFFSFIGPCSPTPSHVLVRPLGSSFEWYTCTGLWYSINTAAESEETWSHMSQPSSHSFLCRHRLLLTPQLRLRPRHRGIILFVRHIRQTDGDFARLSPFHMILDIDVVRRCWVGILICRLF